MYRNGYGVPQDDAEAQRLARERLREWLEEHGE